MNPQSFYFFDLDDNIFYLSSKVTLYHKKTNEPIKVNTSEISKLDHCKVSQSKYCEYEFRETGGDDDSFRRFRDHGLKIEPFEEDILSCLKKPESQWKGPSWTAFSYAVSKNRPISIITARGHFEETIKKGINLFYKKGYLECEPNYLAIFALNNKRTRRMLTNKSQVPLSELKKLAVVKSIEVAFSKYGFDEQHKFGVSDDNLKNMKSIFEAMKLLKKKYPKNEFYCFHMDGIRKVVDIL